MAGVTARNTICSQLLDGRRRAESQKIDLWPYLGRLDNLLDAIVEATSYTSCTLVRDRGPVLPVAAPRCMWLVIV
jgi:hypothetical protein